MVAGIGTEVGKTVVSGILATLLQADYWKPVQSGSENESDTTIMKQWLDTEKHMIHPPSYSFQAPLSPHHAAFLENITVDIESIKIPTTKRNLVIEGVGGIYVPLTTTELTIDRFSTWNCGWIVVSKHYLGSINHTLLTIEALKRRQVPLLGIIFNGESNPQTERTLLEISKLRCLGRLFPEQKLTPTIIQRYAKEWKPNFSPIQQ